MSRSISDLKQRLNSVRQTRQITNAMYLLAAAGLKGGAAAAAYSAQYTESIRQTLCALLYGGSGDLQKEGGGKAVFICFFGDKGLCGSFQHAIAKYAAALAQETPDALFYGFGARAAQLMENAGVPVAGVFGGSAMHPDPSDAKTVAAEARRLFAEENCRFVDLIYTPYHRVVHTPARRRLFPVTQETETANELPKAGDLLMEPDAGALLDHILPVWCTAEVYSAMVQSAAGENAARMDAMQSATDNADEMIASLEQEMHMARQLTITNEITEIAAAASLQERIRKTGETESGGEQ
ncbi:MAG: F0F1 ATP synthase subunit gamma [Clostridia bacterium]|nr:F0F1 ATP synthase subunit gamma [Clostridia bacterium]